MLGLPKSTEIKRPLPKSTIYKKFQLNNTVKDRFDADISRMDIIHEISSSTLAVEESETVKSIFVVLVTLKRPEFAEANFALIARLIEQNMLFVLRYEERACMAIYYAKFMTSEWLPLNELSLNLFGLNLEQMWHNIVMQIGQIQPEAGRTIEEQICINDAKSRLERQIERLEKIAWNEIQPHKKFQLVKELQQLKNELHNLQ